MPDEDRVVLITGATGAVGRVAAAAFAADGWRLGLVGRDESRLREVASGSGARADADRWVPAVADLREATGAQLAVDTVTARFGRIDALIQLVGGFVQGAPILELDPSDLDFMLDQHVRSTLHLTRAVVPGMIERGFGRILAVTSFTTVSVPARAAIYSTTKIAEETLLRILAKEVASTGVTVNLVAVREPSPKNAAWTTPEEIVATFRFLASDAAGAINGARIPLDGRA
jgi:NAD(P)-dependent dehydrogenase (short-subunit alcohol dehydrogenase family)